MMVDSASNINEHPETESADSATFEMGNQRGDGLHRALAAVSVALGNHARDPVLLDMRKVTPVFDYFLIVTGASRRQVYAIAEEIHLELRRVWNDRRIGFEGAEECRWIILDYGDLVIHVFDAEARNYYRLEDLWAAAESVDLSNVTDEPNRPVVSENHVSDSEVADSSANSSSEPSEASSDSTETDDGV